MENDLLAGKEEPADVVCNNCTMDLIQQEAPRTAPKIFSPQYYIKWEYFCQKCGYKSKVFCSKLAKQPTQAQ